MKPSGRVNIIGAGMVGASIAYSLVLRQITSHINLIDLNDDLALANKMDLTDASYIVGKVTTEVINYSQIEEGDIVVITAGARQAPGQTRLDLLQTNAQILKSICDELNTVNHKFYVVLVTNPVDVLTYLAQQWLDLPSQFVFGSGTYLDTLRLRQTLAGKLQINAADINAFVIGEHGDSSVVVTSGLSEDLDRKDLAKEVRQYAAEIISGKGATYFGIGATVSELCKSILRDEDRVFPLSVNPEGKYGLGNNLCIGLPANIGQQGVKVAQEILLNDEEKVDLVVSAGKLKEAVKKFG